MAISDSVEVYGKVSGKVSQNRVTNKISKLIGFNYPIKDNQYSGYFSKSAGFNVIKSNLNILLRTERGERFMLPNYGASLRRYLMEPLDGTLFNEITKEIKESISRYLNKVVVSKIQVFETRQSGVNVKLFCSYRDEEFSKFESNIRI